MMSFQILLFFSILFSLTISSKLPTRRIIVYPFPGASSHHKIFSILMNYTKNTQNLYNYEYYVICHSVDSNFWYNLNNNTNPNNNVNSPSFKYIIYPFGSSSLKNTLEQAINNMQNSLLKGYLSFQEFFIQILNEFLDSEIVDTLVKIKDDYENKRKGQPYFHCIITDIPNFIHKILYEKLNLRLSIYLNPTLTPELHYPFFEYNANYIPSISSPYSDEMSYIERLCNSFRHFTNKIIFNFLMNYQKSIVESKGYQIKGDIYVKKSFNMIQYPIGINFPISLPPNFALLGSITAKQGNNINNPQLISFFSKYSRIIYISQGTLVKPMLSKEIYKDICLHFQRKSIGILIQIKSYIQYDLSENCFQIQWVEQNDIFETNKVEVFVTHGGANSVYESIYHNVPMVILGMNIDHINIASVCKKRKIAEIINKNELDSNNIIMKIEKVLNSRYYSLNAENLSKIMRYSKPATETFKYWLDFGFNYGYSSLYISLYGVENSFIKINGYDIMLFWIFALFIILYINYRIFLIVYDCFCGTCENKHRKKKIKKIKID